MTTPDDDREERHDRRRADVPRRDPEVRERMTDADRDGIVDDDRHRRAAYVDRDEVVAREREAFGGMKIGAAFFGWLSAMGMAVLLTALLAAVGAAVGLGTGTTVEEAAEQAQQDPTGIGWVGLVGLLVILFVAYFAGGYVAGRMARFDGAKQGLGVWLWALVAAIVVAVLGLVAGDEFNLLERVNAFPRIPVNEGELTTIGIVAAVLAALVPLVAAMLGGQAGMRFHRNVDAAGLDYR
jgi:hypothetical protein